MFLFNQDHNAVRAMLREKDEEIHQMKIENKEIRAQLKVATEENTILHNRYDNISVQQRISEKKTLLFKIAIFNSRWNRCTLPTCIVEPCVLFILCM